jgi:hypothetical protein
MAMNGRHRFLIVSIVLVVVTGGCTVTHQWIYDKRGMTVESLDRDRAGCRAASPPQGLTAMFGIDDVDRETFTRCMEGRGYTARRLAR